MRAWLPYVVSLSFALAACGDSEGTGASSQTGGGGQAQGGQAEGGGGGTFEGGAPAGGSSGEGGSGGGFIPMTCNELESVAALVTETANAGAPPAMTGGAITAGTYELTAVTIYNTDTPGPSSYRETLVFTATDLDSINVTNEGLPTRGSATYTTSAEDLILAFDCPQEFDLTQTYSSDGITLSLVGSNPNRVLTYQLQ